MKIREEYGLTFDDVLLVPQRSSVVSRRDVSTSTLFSRRITLQIPIVSANMDTVTESRMAIAMARAGGLGVIHRFLSIDRQVAEVRSVKRAESFIVEHPSTIKPDAPVREARAIMENAGIGGLVVLDNDGRVAGIVTTRDVQFASNDDRVNDVMTPQAKLITAPQGTTMEEAGVILHRHRIEKLPLVDKYGGLAGLITAKDIQALTQHPSATKDSRGRLRVAAAVGVRGDAIERAQALIEAGADALVLDIAHGHSDQAIQVIQQLRKLTDDVDIVAGNVATGDGARDLANAGADAIKVGVGSGSICITRIVAGAGVPQLTAIIDSSQAAGSIPIIADGGMRTSGDIAKALAAGAATAMLGSLLAGTDEAPGVTLMRDGRKYKVTRGMASLTATMTRRTAEADPLSPPVTENMELGLDEVVPEGVEGSVPYRGSVDEVLHQLVGGVRSGMSYCGARSIKEMQEKAEFVKITPAGLRESHPHDVERL